MKKNSILFLGMLSIASFALMSFIVFDNYNMMVPDSVFSTPENVKNMENTHKKVSDNSTLVADALAFKALLTTTQQNTLQQTYTTTLARKWSNLPCGATCRNGIQFGSLTSAQLTAALKIVADALGTTSNNGYDEFLQIRAAEDILGANGGGTSNYNSGLRWIAFLNEPSETGSWMLQFGGHHYAANIAFKNGHVIGATPFFVALEPTTWTSNGTTYGPMEDEKTAFRNMLASLSSSQLSTAKLSSTFSDCLMSPGESNGNTNTMPTTKQGLKVSNLTDSQKTLVIAAIQNYVQDLDATAAAAIIARYTSEIDNTYIAYTGNGTSGNASTFLTSNTNYIRIDGPTVWIEFICQNGIVYQSQIHYHSVWRDHSHDYGLDLNGDAIDVLATNEVNNSLKSITIYPNPTSETLNIEAKNKLYNATIKVFNASGKVVASINNVIGKTANIAVSKLNAGNYVIMISDNNQNFTAKFIKK